MNFSLRITPSSPVISSVVVKLGNQVQTFSSQDAGPKQFVWNVSTPRAELNVLLSGGVHLSDLQFGGAWAIFRLVDTLKLIAQGDSQLSYEWILKERSSDLEVHDQSGNPVKIRLDISGDSTALFRADNRSGLQCIAAVTQ
jgi:type VI protein secretion system component VasK